MSTRKEDIIRMVRDEDIEFIRLQFTDIFGQLKNVAITASQIEKAVNNQIMFDGSSIEGFVRIDESDQYLYPDLDSFAIFPWRPSHGKVARLICDVYNPDGTPFVGDPRYVLKKVLQKAKDMGYDAFNVGPEAEFFLFQTDDEGKPTTKTNDEAGYFDLGPRPTTRRATSTWVPWITARAPGGRSAWLWSRWASRSRPAITRWPRASTRSTSNTPAPSTPPTTS